MLWPEVGGACEGVVDSTICVGREAAKAAVLTVLVPIKGEALEGKNTSS